MKWSSLGRSLVMGVALCAGAAHSQAAAEVYDPWEGFNRKVFAFNDGLDSYLLKPLAKGYRAITPRPLETGISNMFDNLLEIRNLVNDLLQGDLAQAGNDSGRLLINTTVGVAGLFDVATHLGLPESDGEDFGQTLAMWGVGQGPYLVLPLLGSSTLRDSLGKPANSLLNPIRYVDHVPTRNSIYGVDIIDTRAGLLDAETLISGDKYTYVRDAYLQRRDFLINNGEVEDGFESDFDF